MFSGMASFSHLHSCDFPLTNMRQYVCIVFLHVCNFFKGRTWNGATDDRELFTLFQKFLALQGATAHPLRESPPLLDNDTANDLGDMVTQGPSTARSSDPRADESTANEDIRERLVAASQAWRSCISFRVAGDYLLGADGSSIPLSDVEFQDLDAFPNTHFRFKASSSKVTIPKKEEIILGSKKAQNFCLQHLRDVLMEDEPAKFLMLKTSTPMVAMKGEATPFCTKTFSALMEHFRDYLISSKRHQLEEAKYFLAVVPEDLITVFAAKKIDSHAGQLQLGKGFPVLSDSNIKKEFEKRKLFISTLSVLCLNESKTFSTSQEREMMISWSISKMTLPLVVDAFYNFVDARLYLRQRVLRDFDKKSVPVSDLLHSNFLEEQLFGSEEVEKILHEARSFHSSVYELLSDSSFRKRKASVSIKPENNKFFRPQGWPQPNFSGLRYQRNNARENQRGFVPPRQGLGKTSSRPTENRDKNSDQSAAIQTPSSRPGRGKPKGSQKI